MCRSERSEESVTLGLSAGMDSSSPAAGGLLENDILAEPHFRENNTDVKFNEGSYLLTEGMIADEATQCLAGPGQRAKDGDTLTQQPFG